MNDVGETFDSLSKSVKSSIYKTNLVIGRTQRMISEKTKINHCDRLSTADEAMNELISELRDIQARLFIIEGKASHLMLSTKEVRHSIPPTRSREPSAYLLTLNDHIFSPQNVSISICPIPLQTCGVSTYLQHACNYNNHLIISSVACMSL